MFPVEDCRPYFERISTTPHPPAWLRLLATVHAAGLRLERSLRPRRRGRGSRPWVIGIGNLEAGGTGKTPTVVLIAKALAAAGSTTAVLTRGHGGRLGQRRPLQLQADLLALATDESRLLWEALGERVPIIVGRNKRRGLELLRGRPEVEIVVVDDAFQSADLEVDRHLVLLDWQKPLANGHLLPAGRLREGAQALRRAHAVLFTRAHGPGVPQNPAWAHLEAGELFLAVEKAVALTRPDGTPIDPAMLRGSGLALLSGLGRPEAFESLAQAFANEHGFQIRHSVRVRDHGDLEAALSRLRLRLERLGCEHIVITRKDQLRLSPERKQSEPLLVLEQRLVIEALPRLLSILVPA